MTAFRPIKKLTRVLAGVAAAVLECAWAQIAYPQNGTTAAPAAGLASPTYTSSQADSGKAIYGQQCIACHGANLDNGELGPPLSGQEFSQKWGNHRLDELFDYISTKMPSSAPGSLTPEQVANLLAYMMQRTEWSQAQSRPEDSAALKNIRDRHAGVLFGHACERCGSAASAASDGESTRPNHPVTESMLDKPGADDWITWRARRRTRVSARLSRSTRECGSVDHGLVVGAAGRLE